MALVTFTCLLMAGLESNNLTFEPLRWILGGMLDGIIITLIRRLRYLSQTLQDRAGNSNMES